MRMDTDVESSGLPPGLLRRVLVVTICALVIYCAVVVAADFRAVRESLHKLPLQSLPLALGLATASFVVRFVRWRGYLRALDVPVSAGDSVLIFGAGLGMSVTPGKAGELLKSVMLQQASNTPVARSVSIIAAERTTDAMALALLGGFGLIGTAYGPLAAAFATLSCAALSVVLGWRSAGARAIALACFIPLLRKHRARLVLAHESLLRLCAPITLLQALALGVLSWTIHGLCLLHVANVFEGAGITIGQAMVANAVPLLAGALAMLPGGLGLTEASLAGALLAFGEGRITPATATAITLVVRFSTLWWAVLLGLVALGAWQLRRLQTRTRGVF